MPENPLQPIPAPALSPAETIRQKGDNGGNVLLPNVKHWLNLLGSLRTTTNTPTRAPRMMSDSILIYVNSIASPTVKKLYVYSKECDTWFSVNLT